MMRVCLVSLTLLVVMLYARPSSAQETAHVGLMAAFPSAVGVVWQPTTLFAVKSDFTFSQSGTDTFESSSTSVGVGIGPVFYLRKWDNLRAYLSPRFGYQRFSFTTSASSFSSPLTNNYSGSGSFGAEYLLHRHFAVFGETGLVYSRSRNVSSSTIAGPALGSGSYSWGTRTGVGTILYF
jgi:hypothetical protein